MQLNRQWGWSAFILGGFICCGLIALGYQLAHAAIAYKQLERTVTVKGLAEQEVPADIVIWPIQFIQADNQLEALYTALESSTEQIETFLLKAGIPASDITLAAPAITDKSAQQYGGSARPEFRYSALQTVTVYSTQVDKVRMVMTQLSELGKQGIVFTGDQYQSSTEYLFSSLNEIKPEMIEAATANARAVAEKFAADSHSQIGKIKTASQGQFSIVARDKNNPHIKKVRVVSTVEYYLSD